MLAGDVRHARALAVAVLHVDPALAQQHRHHRAVAGLGGAHGGRVAVLVLRGDDGPHLAVAVLGNHDADEGDDEVDVAAAARVVKEVLGANSIDSDHFFRSAFGLFCHIQLGMELHSNKSGPKSCPKRTKLEVYAALRITFRSVLGHILGLLFRPKNCCRIATLPPPVGQGHGRVRRVAVEEQPHHTAVGLLARHVEGSGNLTALFPTLKGQQQAMA